VRDYLKDRHRLEARYDQLSAEQLNDLAHKQCADYVIALAMPPRDEKAGPKGEASQNLAARLNKHNSRAEPASWECEAPLERISWECEAPAEPAIQEYKSPVEPGLEITRREPRTPRMMETRWGSTEIARREPRTPGGSRTKLDLLHTEGRYAVYRVRPQLLSQRQR
jgi:hypothetical protein